MGKPIDKRDRNREHDARRRTEQPWRKWYGTARWRELRARQLSAEPFCRMCSTRGQQTLARVCDHVTPHRGDPVRFWDQRNLQSLCAPCHDADKQALERGGVPRRAIGADGWPIG